MTTTRIISVCSGNICRSPMAEGILIKELAKRKIPHVVLSMGTLNIFGAPADKNAVTACEEIGVDLSGHRSQGLNPFLLEHSDAVIVMEEHHAQAIAKQVPNDRIVRLWEYTENKITFIPDPVGLPLETFRAARNLIQGACIRWIDSRW